MSHPLHIPPENVVLVVVDMQERLLAAMPDGNTVEQTVCRMLRSAHLLNAPILATEQYPKGLGPTSPPVKEVLAERNTPIEKTAFSCWGASAFCAAITSLKPSALILTGLETHVCVQQTALDAKKRGYEVIIPADTVTSRHPESKAAALTLMQAHGVVVTTAEALAFAWLADATHPRFKDVSRLFK